MTDQPIQLAMSYDYPHHPIMPTSRNGRALLQALQEGHRLTPLTAPSICRVVAVSQECGRLRALHWPIKSEWKSLESGKRVKEYFL